MMKKSVKGDITLSPDHVLVTSVNCFGVMGAGNALAFKEKLSEESVALYKANCKSGYMKANAYLQLYDKSMKRHIVFLATKYDFRENSRLDLIEKGLIALADWLEYSEVDTCSIPPLGCGLGGLDWQFQVLPLVRKYLGPIKTEISVYY